MSATGFNDEGNRPGEVPSVAEADPRGESERRRGFLTVAVAFSLLAVTCLLAGFLAWRNVRATATVLESWEERRAGTLVLEALLNAETGQRGYVLTRDPAYLKPYAAATRDFTGRLAFLRASTTDADREALVERIAGAGTEKLAELDRTITLVKDGRPEDAKRIVNLGTGKTLMDDVRQALETLTVSLDGQITRATDMQSLLSTLLVTAILVALAGVSWLAALFLTDTRRHFGALRLRELSLRHFAATLEREVAKRNLSLSEVNQRFDVALRASGVTVMTQDRDLMFTWISRGALGLSAREVIGRTEQEITPEPSSEAVISLKNSVIATGEPARGDVRVVRQGNEIWYDLSVHPLKDAKGETTGIIAGAVEITRYKQQEAHIRLLMRELTHRSKNLLAVIEAIMRQTLNNSVSLADFENRFSARVQALAGSHDLLVRDDWQGASLGELVRSQLGHYTDLVGSQIELSGEELHIVPDAAQNIGMALHELATNAAKYGALSRPAGKVRIFWSVAPGPDGAPACHLTWEESGGPPVERPSRRGFGRVVIERTVARAVGGKVRLDFAPAGVRWSMVFPTTCLLAR